MERIIRTTVALILVTVLSAPFIAQSAPDKGGSLDTLKQYMVDLKKTPNSAELKEKIIKYAQSMKQKPPVPEEYERQMARGNAFMKKAADEAGFKKAVDEFQDALLLAPWMPDAYVDIAAAQEKANLFAEAIQNLNLALLADPNAKNSRELRNKIYELEVYAEEAHQNLKGGPTAPPPAPAVVPVPTTIVKKAPAEKKKPEAQEKKINPKVFAGNWYYKDTAPRGGEEITTHAFTINLNAAGELVAAPPRRSSGATGVVSAFELDGNAIRVQVTWKLPSIPSYWKSEEFDVKLSDDESKLLGSYRVKSSGRGEFSEDKVLYKQ